MDKKVQIADKAHKTQTFFAWVTFVIIATGRRSGLLKTCQKSYVRSILLFFT